MSGTLRTVAQALCLSLLTVPGTSLWTAVSTGAAFSGVLGGRLIRWKGGQAWMWATGSAMAGAVLYALTASYVQHNRMGAEAAMEGFIAWPRIISYVTLVVPTVLVLFYRSHLPYAPVTARTLSSIAGVVGVCATAGVLAGVLALVFFNAAAWGMRYAQGDPLQRALQAAPLIYTLTILWSVALPLGLLFVLLEDPVVETPVLFWTLASALAVAMAAGVWFVVWYFGISWLKQRAYLQHPTELIELGPRTAVAAAANGVIVQHVAQPMPVKRPDASVSPENVSSSDEREDWVAGLSVPRSVLTRLATTSGQSPVRSPSTDRKSLSAATSPTALQPAASAAVNFAASSAPSPAPSSSVEHALSTIRAEEVYSLGAIAASVFLSFSIGILVTHHAWQVLRACFVFRTVPMRWYEWLCAVLAVSVGAIGAGPIAKAFGRAIFPTATGGSVHAIGDAINYNFVRNQSSMNPLSLVLADGATAVSILLVAVALSTAQVGGNLWLHPSVFVWCRLGSFAAYAVYTTVQQQRQRRLSSNAASTADGRPTSPTKRLSQQFPVAALLRWRVLGTIVAWSTGISVMAWVVFVAAAWVIPTVRRIKQS